MTDERDLGIANTERHEGQAIAAKPIVDWTSDRYETIEVLGRGGMGEVALTRDKRVGRDVAKKRMHSTSSSSVAVTIPAASRRMIPNV